MNKLTASELEEVHAVLDTGTEGLDSGELDGFLTAIASAPRHIAPDDWLGTVLGDFGFKSDTDATRFIGLIFRRYNEVIDHLNEADSPWPPPSMDEDETAEWCSGYIQGVREDPTWSEDEKATIHLFLIAALAGEVNLVGELGADENVIEDAAPHLAKYRAMLPEAVRTLEEHWAEQRAIEINSSLPAVSVKQNRNAPCACGSGRKHKKCCG